MAPPFARPRAAFPRAGVSRLTGRRCTPARGTLPTSSPAHPAMQLGRPLRIALRAGLAQIRAKRGQVAAVDLHQLRWALGRGRQTAAGTCLRCHRVVVDGGPLFEAPLVQVAPQRGGRDSAAQLVELRRRRFCCGAGPGACRGRCELVVLVGEHPGASSALLKALPRQRLLRQSRHLRGALQRSSDPRHTQATPLRQLLDQLRASQPLIPELLLAALEGCKLPPLHPPHPLCAREHPGRHARGERTLQHACRVLLCRRRRGVGPAVRAPAHAAGVRPPLERSAPCLPGRERNNCDLPRHFARALGLESARKSHQDGRASDSGRAHGSAAALPPRKRKVG